MNSRRDGGTTSISPEGPSVVIFGAVRFSVPAAARNASAVNTPSREVMTRSLRFLSSARSKSNFSGSAAACGFFALTIGAAAGANRRLRTSSRTVPGALSGKRL